MQNYILTLSIPNWNQNQSALDQVALIGMNLIQNFKLTIVTHAKHKMKKVTESRVERRKQDEYERNMNQIEKSTFVSINYRLS